MAVLSKRPHPRPRTEQKTVPAGKPAQIPVVQSTPRPRVRPEWLTRLAALSIANALPTIFLVIGIPIGLTYALLLAPLQAPDESAHFFRAYSVSTGRCVPPVSDSIPESLHNLARRFTGGFDALRTIQFLDYWQPLTRHPYSAGTRLITINPAANINSCIGYAAAGAGVAAARALSQPALVLMYCGRIANLAFYLAFIYFALKIAPIGRAGLFCLALMPMAIHQGASLSSDSLSISSAFLYVAYVLYLAYGNRVTTIRVRQLLLLGALALFSSQCKLNPWLVLLTGLIPAARFGSRTRKAVVIGLVLVLILGAMLIWQHVDQPNARMLESTRTGRDIHVDRNLSFVRDHPLTYFRSLLYTCWVYGPFYTRSFVGQLGWLTIRLPDWLIAAYVALLALAACTGSRRLSRTERLVCFGTCLGTLISIFVLLFSMETTQAELSQMASGHLLWIQGVQGRYLIPIAPVFLVLLGSSRFRLRAPAWPLVCIAGVLLVNCIALPRVYASFYTPRAPLRNIAGLYSGGLWLQDPGGHEFAPDGAYGRCWFGGIPGDVPVTGDWSGDGKRKIGIYRKGLWILDWAGDCEVTSANRAFVFGGDKDDIPVVGDWTGDGRTKLGVYRRGLWILDTNGNGKLEPGVDPVMRFGEPGDIPVVGDWHNTGKAKIGVVHAGTWILDTNGDGKLDRQDERITLASQPGDTPVVGDWNATGTVKLGVVRDGSDWFLDWNGDYRLQEFRYGAKGYIPVVGPWRQPY